MNMYKRHRYVREIIIYAVKLYHRYSLSLRDIQEILLYRGIDVTYEAIRYWCNKFGPVIARTLLKKKQFQPGDKWHIDEVRIAIKGEVYWLWCTIDQNDNELEILLQRRRNTKAARRFFQKMLKRYNFIPRVIITDKLRSYTAARKQVLKKVEHRRHKGLNNRIENSHQYTRVRERQMRKFKSPGQLQRFLSISGQFLNLLKVGRYKYTALEYKNKLQEAFAFYNQVTSSQHSI